MSRYFIDRPIFAWVIAIVIMMAGVISIITLPVAQYPAIAPPAISITGNYPGASAQTVEDSVTQVIEQKMKGIDGLRYMSSSSDSSGAVNITLTLENGTNPDIGQVQVQNKLQLAMPLLPQVVQQQGLTVAKSTKNFLMVMAFVSEDDSMKQYDLADYVAANVLDSVSRVKGVGDVTMFGGQYAMRIWLDPAKLNAFKLTPVDVIAAIQAQNAQVSAGQLGGTPAVKGQQLNATITAQSRLQTPDQFKKIILKTNPSGGAVLLGDVAKVELGSENYGTLARFNTHAATGIAIKMSTGANALDTAVAVKAKINALSKFFPPSMKAVVAYDTTPYVKLSIEEVIKTLLEAVVLVFLVMYLFLQNFRATLIPTIAVPVVLLGTFAVLNAFGYSINTLTMFAMVLAIGLLVDDAIVVVENVERVMHEDGLDPKTATQKSMGQITGALIGIALVLSAVYIPMAFFGGSTGVIYRQFSITVVSAMVLSVIVALILTPALCATLLKPVEKGPTFESRGFFGWFNRNFDQSSQKYQNVVARILKRSTPYLIIYGAIVVLMGVLFAYQPGGFLPDEDQGVLYSQIVLPAGATQARTLEVVKAVEHQFLVEEGENVATMFGVVGYSFGGSGQNAGLAFVRLKPWDERTRPDQRVQAVVARAMKAFSQIRDARVFAFAPPAALELGNASGFDLQLEDNASLGHEKLMQARNQLLGLASKDPVLFAVRPNGQDDTPEYRLDVDRLKASSLGLSMSEINTDISTALGSAYVNDFIDKGRIKKVYVQGQAESRMLPQDIGQWFAKNNKGEMVPFSAFSTGRWAYASPRRERYNGLPSIEIQGQSAPGKSSGEALQEMVKLVGQLPEGIGYEWTGISDQESSSGNQAPILYTVSILFVFLCLAALYESWAIPFSVILVVPLGIVGAVFAASLRGFADDVYLQVGLLTTVGLSAKNAILIVQFAKAQMEAGGELVESTLEAVRMRLRPILMTSLAFGFGVLPLAISHGAGSGAQNAIGTSVLGGMISATVLGIFFVPLSFVWIRKVFKDKGDLSRFGSQKITK
jgi:multidrug efflux pump